MVDMPIEYNSIDLKKRGGGVKTEFHYLLLNRFTNEEGIGIRTLRKE